MSDNLLDGLTLKLMNGTTSESDGTWHNAARTLRDHLDYLVWDLPDQAALATNQTYHVGLSTRGASASDTSLHASIGCYKDAAGSTTYVTSSALAIGTSWGRVEGTLVVPSGMRPFGFYVAAYGVCPEMWMAAPTLSLGSPVTLASSAHTPYATQDHLRSEYATKAALKVTSDAAKSTADSLATMIREDATGITVGKTADGTTYATGRTLQTADAFKVLDKAGNVLSSFGANLIELGKNSMDATISMLAGLVKIQARNDGSNTVASVSSDFLSLDSLWKAVMRAGKETGGAHVEGYAAAIAEVTGRRGSARLYCTQGNGSRITANNAFTVLPDGYDLGRPEYLAAALLGTGSGGGMGITHSQDAVTMAPDLDACGPGVFSYNESTAHAPTSYGTCVCIRAGDGTDASSWLFEFALPTTGDPYWRRNINGAGWEGWLTIKSQ